MSKKGKRRKRRRKSTSAPTPRQSGAPSTPTPKPVARKDAAGSRRTEETTSDSEPSGALRAWLRLWWLVVPVAVVVAYHAVSSFELSADARFLIADNRYVRDLSYWWDTLTHDYFWSSSGNQIPYYRPLTKLSWLLEHQLFGNAPGGYHVVQLAWWVLGVVGVQALARTLGASIPWSMVAAASFGLHPIAIAPTSLVMARSDVVVTALSAWVVLGWLKWQEGGRRSALWATLHGVSLLLALGSKETAVVLPVVLLGFAWADGQLRQRWPRLLLGVALTAAYLVARHQVLAAEDATMNQIGLELRPLRLFAGLAAYLRGMWPLRLESTVRDLSLSEARSAGFVVAGLIALSILGAVFAVAVRSRDRRQVVLLGWMLAALAPVLLPERILVPVGGSSFALADRWLLHALPAGMLALARLGGHAEARLNERQRRWLVLGAAGATGAWALAMLFGTSQLRAEFRSEAGLLDNEDRLYRATPARYRTLEDECRFLERKVVRVLGTPDHAAVIDRSRSLIQRCGPTPNRNYYLFTALMNAGRLKEAAPLADELIAKPPPDRRGHGSLSFLLGRLALALGKPADAERWLARSAELGYGNCQLWLMLGEAQHRQSKLPEAAKQLVNAYRCGGKRDASLLLAASTWLLQAGERSPAADLLARAESHTLSADQKAQASAIRRALAGDDVELTPPALR